MSFRFAAIAVAGVIITDGAADATAGIADERPRSRRRERGSVAND